MNYIASRTMNELLDDKAKALAMWKGIIQKYIDTNQPDVVERMKKQMDECAKRYDSAILEKRKWLDEIELRKMEHKKKVHDLVFGNTMVEIMTEIFGSNEKPIRGYVMVAQWDEHLISNEFTTLKEFLEQGPSFMTLYRPNELKEKKAELGHVLFEIWENGILKKIDANYDGSD